MVLPRDGHALRVEGHVSSTKPLSHQGTLIDDIRVRFEGGRIVEAKASRGEAVLKFNTVIGYAAEDLAPGTWMHSHNILFDANGRGWLIDFDRGVLRIPATGWRERNLKRLLRSLLKLRGERSREDVEKDFARLRRAYELAWSRGV